MANRRVPSRSIHSMPGKAVILNREPLNPRPIGSSRGEVVATGSLPSTAKEDCNGSSRPDRLDGMADRRPRTGSEGPGLADNKGWPGERIGRHPDQRRTRVHQPPTTSATGGGRSSGRYDASSSLVRVRRSGKRTHRGPDWCPPAPGLETGREAPAGLREAASGTEKTWLERASSSSHLFDCEPNRSSEGQ